MERKYSQIEVKYSRIKQQHLNKEKLRGDYDERSYYCN